MDNNYEVRVIENVWKHKCNVKFLGLIQFEDKIYEHMHGGKINNLR